MPDEPVLRPYRAGDQAAVHALFRSTLLLGHDAPPVQLFERYAALCLDWYLSAGAADAAVVEVGGVVRGYALVCADAAMHRSWANRRTWALTGHVLVRVLTGRLDETSRRFYWCRARDGWDLWRAGHTPPLPVHAHLNVASGSRSGTVALMLRDHIDRRAARSGAEGWFGEMNAIVGTREHALARLGLEIRCRTTNRTLSALLGRPVHRLTVTRMLPTAAVAAVGQHVIGEAAGTARR